MVSNGNSDVVERHNLHAHSGGIQAIENGGLPKTADEWNSNATRGAPGIPQCGILPDVGVRHY